MSPNTTHTDQRARRIQPHTTHRDLPRAIMLSLGVCVTLYSAVCLVITGLVPYDQIDLSAPLSSAFGG